jgi:hypothetical protein
MKLTESELVLVGLLIVYIAFFTHPPPLPIVQAFESPVGHAVALGGILYVTMYQSFITGIFLAIAYVMTNSRVTEYMTNPSSDKKGGKGKREDFEQPTSSGVPPPAITGALQSLLKKGDTRLPQESQKKGKATPKAPETSAPKASAPKTLEHFGGF